MQLRQHVPVGTDHQHAADLVRGRQQPIVHRERRNDGVPANAFGDRQAKVHPVDRQCGGHVRKLTDCCGHIHKRINGDKALTGYCYHGRKVFCVMYYDTKVKC